MKIVEEVYARGVYKEWCQNRIGVFSRRTLIFVSRIKAEIR